MLGEIIWLINGSKILAVVEITETSGGYWKGQTLDNEVWTGPINQLQQSVTSSFQRIS